MIESKEEQRGSPSIPLSVRSAPDKELAMTILAVPTARVGQTALTIPRIGLGTAPLAAGTAYKAGVPVGQERASAVIDTALSQGMCWFDTALTTEEG